MNRSQSRFIVLSFDYGWLILFVHTLNSLTSVSLKILITRFNGVLNINDFLFSKVFQVHIFGPNDLFLIFLDFDFHFIDETNSDTVQKFGAETVFHVGQNDKEESPATSVFAVFGFELLLFFCADDRIEKTSQCRNKFFVTIVRWSLIFLFLSLFLDLEEIIFRTGLIWSRFSYLVIFILILILILIFYFVFRK